MRVTWHELLAVLVGGAVGTGLRFTVDALVPHPYSTLAVNVVGAFVLGLAVARLWESSPAWLRAGMGAGLLGSFTTFSALAVILVELTTAGETWQAALYLGATLVLGLTAAFLGLHLGRPRRIDLVNE